MASGFMSSVVNRIFHSKGKDRSPGSDHKAAKTRKYLHDDLSLSLSSSPSPATSSVVKRRDKTRTTDQGNISTPKFAGKKGGHSTPEGAVKKRDQTKRKSLLFSSLRKKARPLSCITARPDSPTHLTGDGWIDDVEPKTPKDWNNKNKGEETPGSRQRKEKKLQRPLSCIVQPPSPRLLPSVNNSPELHHQNAKKAADSDNENKRDGSARCEKAQQKPRPVSCFVEAPPQERSPPPYIRKPYGPSPQVSGPIDQHTPFRMGTPPQIPPFYLEASRRSPMLASLSKQSQFFAAENPGETLLYRDPTQQPVARYAEDTRHSPYYAARQQDAQSFYAENNKQATSYYAQTPRQSTPILDEAGSPARPGQCRDMNFYLNSCPYQVPAQPQGYGSYSYDLKSYFPSAAPARRYARPQSACFLCEPQACCVAEARRTGRPMSQCFFPDYNMPYFGPNPGPQGERQYQQINSPNSSDDCQLSSSEGNPISFAEGDQVSSSEGHQVTSSEDIQISSLEGVRACYSEDNRAPLENDQEPATGSQLPACSKSEMETSSPAPGSKVSSAVAPQPAKRTLVPRPRSAVIMSTESDGSPMSSPAPSPRLTRFPLKKYRSADCLDRVDELENLEVSPPPAKPLSYFTDAENQQETTTTNSNNKHEEIFTSAEMLEKLGQPRSRSYNQPRPVSCLVGNNADESGYLSNATLGGSGWLGGLSASTGDILEMLDGGDEMDAADDEMSLERSSSLRKAWSVCSLLRRDSIQDRSFTVMRRRRQKMKDRRHTNQRSSSTETDEGVEIKGANSTSSLLGAEAKDGESAIVAGIPLDAKRHVPESREGVTRLHSAHMKAWQIRLRRKQMMKKRRSTERLGPRIETLV